MATKKAAKKIKASKRPAKAKFTVQQLASIRAALLASPATKNLADRVVQALHDPGVTVPPNS
jgi:hypothetical protein